MDLSDDYRNGFVDSLRLDCSRSDAHGGRTRRAHCGNFTVFHNGVYTACAPCKDDPKKPPVWQVKAARIIHDQGEKMLYFEDASLEFFGHPIAWMPYFSAPDPTVKRKTGVLVPSITSSSVYGQSLEVPYYWALAPDYDATLCAHDHHQAGATAAGRIPPAPDQRRLFEIRGAGIYQLDKGYFTSVSATPRPATAISAAAWKPRASFALTDKWVWGWDAVALTDKTFLQDYNPHLSRYTTTDPFVNAASEGHLAALSHRQGQSQLFRRPQHLLPRLLDGRRSATNSGHPSGARLHLHLRPSGARW